MMAVGLGRLGLPPQVFWSMTPKEYAAAIAGLAPNLATRPPSRGELAELMAAFPDPIDRSE